MNLVVSVVGKSIEVSHFSGRLVGFRHRMSSGQVSFPGERHPEGGVGKVDPTLLGFAVGEKRSGIEVRTPFYQGSDSTGSHAVAGKIDSLAIDGERVGYGIDQFFQCLGMIAPIGVGRAGRDEDKTGVILVEFLARKSFGRDFHLSGFDLGGPASCSMKMDEKGKSFLEPLEFPGSEDLKENAILRSGNLNPLIDDLVRKWPRLQSLGPGQVCEVLRDELLVFRGKAGDRDGESPPIGSPHGDGFVIGFLQGALQGAAIIGGPGSNFRAEAN